MASVNLNQADRLELAVNMLPHKNMVAAWRGLDARRVIVRCPARGRGTGNGVHIVHAHVAASQPEGKHGSRANRVRDG